MLVSLLKNTSLLILLCHILIADVFEPFLKSYLEKFQHQTVTTKEWIDYLEQYFHDKVHTTRDILQKVINSKFLLTI